MFSISALKKTKKNNNTKKLYNTTLFRVSENLKLNHNIKASV